MSQYFATHRRAFVKEGARSGGEDIHRERGAFLIDRAFTPPSPAEAAAAASAPARPEGAPPHAAPTLKALQGTLLATAKRYHETTGRHLDVYGALGELHAAVTLGMTPSRSHAQGADGRRGDDLIEVKTIAPFSTSQQVTVRLRDRNFSHLFVVRISPSFELEGRLVARRDLPDRSSRSIRLRWRDLPPAPS